MVASHSIGSGDSFGEFYAEYTGKVLFAAQDDVTGQELWISDGTANPYRYNCRPPSFVNLTCLSQIAVGHKLADAVVILGSFDIVMGEVDR